MNKLTLTQEELKKYLKYNSNTGIFVWAVNRSRGIKAGDVAGTIRDGYRSITINSKTFQAHRLAWLYEHGRMPVDLIDHINRDKQDNRIENLREVNASQNKMNSLKMSNNKSGHRGVHWCKKKERWVAQCKIGDKYKNLGLFKNINDAIKKYNDTTRIHHGEYKPI